MKLRFSCIENAQRMCGLETLSFGAFNQDLWDQFSSAQSSWGGHQDSTVFVVAVLLTKKISASSTPFIRHRRHHHQMSKLYQVCCFLLSWLCMLHIICTVRFKNFRVENFRYLLKTFEIFEIHDLYQDVKTFEVFDISKYFWELKLASSSKLGQIFHFIIKVDRKICFETTFYSRFTLVCKFSANLSKNFRQKL